LQIVEKSKETENHMSKKFRVVVGSFAVVAFAAAGFASTSLAAPTHITKNAVKGTVYFIGPEQFTGRWVRDQVYLRNALTKQAPKAKFVYQNGNESEQSQQNFMNQDLAARGKKVIILASIDGVAQANLVDQAHKAKVPVVAYDRLIQDKYLNAYVSFNGPQVGKLQAQWLLGHVPKKGNIIQIWGDHADNNALLFHKGFAGVFDKHFKCPAKQYDTCSKSGKLTDAFGVYTPGWLPSNAQTEMNTALSDVHNKVVGVYAMNDGMADTIYSDLAAAHLFHVPLTGQDGQASGLARILEKEQGMTIYKPLTEEANPAISAAVWWLSGHSWTSKPAGFKPSGQSALSCGTPRADCTNGKRIPAVIGPVLSITLTGKGKNGVGFPVTDGFTTWAAVCADIPGAPVKPYCGRKH
jgi:D-xylose transport system substrate-binding protein